MNLRQLKYFVGVVEAGNMTRAAEQLHVAQTALSMQIRQLEEALGLPLLTRHSRGVEPTPAGALLHQRALEILALVDRTRSEIAASACDTCEPIRIGITPALMPIVGSSLALHIRSHMPRVLLGLIEEMSHVLIEQIQRNELDFIVCYDVPELASLSRIALLQDELVLVTRPSGTPGEPIPLADALAVTLAMPEIGDSVRNAVSKAARDQALALNVAYEIRSISAMRALAVRGAASCILPFASVVEDVRDGKLDARPIVMPPIRRTLFLASAAQRSSRVGDKAITDAVRASLEPLIDILGPLGHPLSAARS